MYVRDVRRTEEAQRPVSRSRHAVLERPVLCQGVSHAHQNSSFYLSRHRQRVHHLAGVEGRVDVGDPSLCIEHGNIRGISVRYVALRMRLVRTELVGRLKVFVLEAPAVHPSESLLSDSLFIHGSFQKLCRLLYGLACHKRLPRSGRGAGIRRVAGIARGYPYLRERKAGSLGDVLHEHRLAALPYVRSRGIYPDKPVLYLKNRPSLVRQANSDARVLHRAGDPDPVRRSIIEVRLDRDERLLQRCRDIGYLSVREFQSRFDGVSVSDLPRAYAGLFGKHIQKRFQRELALAYAEAPEGSRRRIVRIVSVAPYVRVMVVIRSHAVSAGSFEHRSAEACVSACIEIYVAVERRQYAVLIASQRECPLHGVPFRMHPQGFAAAELRLDRPSELKGRKRGYVLGRHILFPAEASSDELVLDDYAFRRILPPQHDADLMSGIVSSLIGREYLHSVPVWERDRALGLEECVLCERRPERACHGVRGFLKGLCGVPSHDMSLLAEVSRGVDLRSAFSLRLRDAPYRLELLVFYLYGLLRLLEYVRGLCDHKAYGVSHHPRRIAFGYHHIPVLLDMPHLVVRHILRGQNAQHSRQRFRLFLYDLFHHRPRILRPDSRAVSHWRHVRIHHGEYVAERLVLSGDCPSDPGQSLRRSLFIFLFRPAGKLHHEIRSVRRHEVFRADVVRVLPVAEDLFPDIDAEHILPHSEL